MGFSINNWRKPANKFVSDIANILVSLNLGLIPTILSLPISSDFKIWIIGGYNILASLVNLYKKGTHDNKSTETDIPNVDLINNH